MSSCQSERELFRHIVSWTMIGMNAHQACKISTSINLYPPAQQSRPRWMFSAASVCQFVCVLTT